MKMKRNEKMQSRSKVSNKGQNNITNKNNNNISNRNKNNITDRNNSNVTDSNKNVGFVSNTSSFELDPEEEHSFKLRDCK